MEETDTILSWASSPKQVSSVIGIVPNRKGVSDILQIDRQYPYWVCVDTYHYSDVLSILIERNVSTRDAFWCSEGLIVTFETRREELTFLLACDLAIISKAIVRGNNDIS